MPTMTQLPASEHTEVTILGAMLVDPLAVQDAVAKIYPEDFLLDSHQKLFRAMLHMHKQGQPIDTTTLNAELIRRGELDSVGGIAYLFRLTEDVPRHLNIDSYAQIIKECARKRDLLKLHADGQALAADPTHDFETQAHDTLTRLNELIEEQATDIQHVGAFLDEQGDAIFEALATTGGVQFGFEGLDRMVGGVVGGDLIILAARPSIGKTAWAIRIAQNVSLDAGKVVALFTLENSKESIIRRWLASAARVDYSRVKYNSTSEVEKAALLAHRRKLAQTALYLDAPRKPTVTQLKSKCARLKRTVGLDLVIVDQLSKVSAADVYQRGMSKHEWVGAQTTAFKLMAQELDVPIVLCNQLNRETAKRTDQTPQLQDLKESGSIEEDADVVILLHRPVFYDASSESPDQMIVAKNREGATGTVDCSYQGRIMRWEN